MQLALVSFHASQTVHSLLLSGLTTISWKSIHICRSPYSTATSLAFNRTNLLGCLHDH